jgi:hypothetical protein
MRLWRNMPPGPCRCGRGPQRSARKATDDPPRTSSTDPSCGTLHHPRLPVCGRSAPQPPDLDCPQGKHLAQAGSAPIPTPIEDLHAPFLTWRRDRRSCHSLSDSRARKRHPATGRIDRQFCVAAPWYRNHVLMSGIKQHLIERVIGAMALVRVGCKPFPLISRGRANPAAQARSLTLALLPGA